jgi:hypothetical protein
MSLPESRKNRLAGQVLKGGGGIDQASVKEHPAGYIADRGAVSQRERDGAPSEGGLVDPRQCRAVRKQLFLDDPPARLFDGDLPAPAEFTQES